MNTQISTPVFDHAMADAFAERLVGALSDAALILMTSFGHRSGLFDTLAGLPAATSEQIAAAAGLSERYVREWLAVMVTSEVVIYAPASGEYQLPAEHAAFLTRAASPDNLAVTAQFISIMAAVEEPMLARLRSGEGLRYEHFQHFHEVMAEDSAQLVLAALDDHILPLVDGLTGHLEQGIEVADVACGGGRALLHLAKTFPASRFVGVDLCAEAFAETQVQAIRLGLENLRFEARDLSAVECLGQFDLITAFDAVHDQRDPQGLLTMMRRSLGPDGVLLMQDIGGSSRLENNIGNPYAPLLYAISLMHCTPISIGQGGAGLGTMWGVETAEEYLAAAGFGDIRMHRLPHDPLNAYFVARA